MHLNDSRTQVTSRHRQNITKCRCSSVFCVLTNSTTSISSIKLPEISFQCIAVQMCFSRSFSWRHLVLSAIITLFYFLLHSYYSRCFLFFFPSPSFGELFIISLVFSGLCLPLFVPPTFWWRSSQRSFLRKGSCKSHR